MALLLSTLILNFTPGCISLADAKKWTMKRRIRFLKLQEIFKSKWYRSSYIIDLLYIFGKTQIFWGSDLSDTASVVFMRRDR